VSAEQGQLSSKVKGSIEKNRQKGKKMNEYFPLREHTSNRIWKNTAE